MPPNPHTLILVKHAMPDIDPRRRTPEWPLSTAGREASVALAKRLERYRPTRVATSVEPKAVGTGAMVAATLGLPVGTASGLHEHDLGEVAFMESEAWNAAVAEVFARPDAAVFGRESATDAGDRFASAVAALRNEFPDDLVVIVGHGRVISQFVARASGVDALGLRRRLGLPSFVGLAPRNGG